MITLEPQAFVAELENAGWFIFCLGFYVGISIGIFIALHFWSRYSPEKPIKRVSTSDTLEE